ncbi:MAG: BlaI/MecI/CopY family transcriptional regulator, partial [Calditrichota bacterium]
RLGDVELEIYNIVCRRKEASVKEVADEINKTRKTAYTSVMTTMKILADKGYLSYERIGKKFVYSPAVQQGELRRSLLERTLESVFNGSALDLVQSLVKSEKISKTELDEIRKMLNEMEDK